MIRKAREEDASRIAEILIFTKRMNYRSIFHDDIGSFVGLQVYPLAKEYLDHPEQLENIWVYDDGFAKGMLHAENGRIVELYVDTFFENNGIGSKLIEFAIKELNCRSLWVLEKNTNAIRFYERHGFRQTAEKTLEQGTTEMLLKMSI
ncbi:MAG: GNAT family N-acetyltransferase [Lachnospiraceae bacterium]|nr:GNAT family N-acetyltransferase [Lachnospiraceae bacterium]